MLLREMESPDWQHTNETTADSVSPVMRKPFRRETPLHDVVIAVVVLVGTRPELFFLLF